MSIEQYNRADTKIKVNKHVCFRNGRCVVRVDKTVEYLLLDCERYECMKNKMLEAQDTLVEERSEMLQE